MSGSTASGEEEALLFSYVVPLYDEGDNVDFVVQGILASAPSSAPPLELILVNNGSSDDTGARIASLAAEHPEIRCVSLPTNAGYGGGILAGMREATGAVLGYGWGDGQIPPEVIWRCAAVVSEGAPWAKATRGVRAEALPRRVQSSAYMAIMQAAFSVPWDDVNGCPKVFQRETWSALAPEATDWFLDPEISLRALRLGLAPVEVPSRHLPRQRGRSKVHLGTALSFVYELGRWRLGLRR